MQKAGAPVAARTTGSATNGDLQDAANLHVQVEGATKKFHLWQQLPAWTLGFAAIGLGFLMVLRGYDSAGGWFAVSTAIIISVIASSGRRSRSVRPPSARRPVIGRRRSLRRRIPRPADRAPDQVRVRHKEAEREKRERGEPSDVEGVREDDRDRVHERH